jgi:Carboxypeptidase regulatory-like domain
MLPKNTSIKLAAFFLSIFMFSQIGCKKTDDVADNKPPNVPPVIANDAVQVAATITGSVIDENNKPVASAAVSADTYSTTTDAMGNFTFRNINVSAANGHVMVVKPGYFKGIRSFVTEKGKNNFVKIQLIKQVVSGTVAAAAGGTVNTDGATINFAPNSFVTATGAAYTGNVKVYAKWIDPTAQNLPVIIPGDLRGLNSTNEESILKSYGMVGAELKDDAGNILKIAPGKTATISFPIPTALQGTAPATIPLWHFDEVAARWREEGTATKTGNTYTATVNKFSFWNCDVPNNFIKLDMRLVNSANNLPLANTMVKINSAVSNTSAYGYTNDSGFVSGYVPNSEILKLEVIAGTACNTNTVAYTQNVGPYTVNTSLGNINITLPASLVVNFTGTVKSCTNQPVSNGYVSLSLASGTSTIAYTNAAGVVNFSLIQCSTGSAYTYNAVDLSNGSYSTTANGTATSNSVNLNTIVACGNSINNNGVYIAGAIDGRAVIWKDGVPTFLTPVVTGNKDAYAIKTLVYNNDVYVLGGEYDSTINGGVTTIKLWKNGVLTNITNGTTNADAYGFDVYNGDVYIGGYETNANIDINKVWKNGIATVLPKDTFDYVEATDIKVLNGDVYVSGSGRKINNTNNNNISDRALYWKNGAINLLSNIGNFSAASGVFLNNADIYFSGQDYINGENIGVYWKNGVESTLNLLSPYTRSDARAIFIGTNDIYVVGTFSKTVPTTNGSGSISNATYWKNNSVNLLTNYNTAGDYAELYGIFVKNNIVYTVGNFYRNSSGLETPLYFQNNIPVPLTGFTNTQYVYIGGIFVQ